MERSAWPTAPARARQLLVALGGQVVDEQLEVRHQRGQPFGAVHALDQLVQAARTAPAALAVVDDQANHRRQVRAARLLPQSLPPDADDLLKDPQRHPSVGLALVLEEQIDVAQRAVKAGAEERVGEPLAQLLVYIVARDRFEGSEVEALAHAPREHGGELAGYVLGDPEGAFEELVVLAHGRAR